MNTTSQKTRTLAILALGFSVGSAYSATWADGYSIGSSLLTPPGALLFEDSSSGGGADIRDDNGVSSEIWEIGSGGNWAIGDTVEITGIALPFWANSTNTVNNTLNGDITITFRSLGVNNVYDTGDVATFGTVVTEFASQNTGVGDFYVNFDSPVSWVADSEGFGFSIGSTASLRLKTGPNASGVVAKNIDNGNVQGYLQSLSVAGNVIPVPEPTSALLGGFGLLFLLRRHR